jgi:hypothetical protein
MASHLKIALKCSYYTAKNNKLFSDLQDRFSSLTGSEDSDKEMQC